jgi:neutral amino acid transport system permease protein
MDWGLIWTSVGRAAIGEFTVVFALAALGLNIHFGYTGLLNFGQVGFMSVGAFGLAIGVTSFGVPFWTGVLLSLGAAVLLALLLGLPTLRLRADYLAIVTIAAAEIVRFVLRSPSTREWTGGSYGLTQFARDFYALNPLDPGVYGVGPFVYSADRAWLLLVGWGLVALMSLSVWLTMRSPWGRVLKAIREEEDAATSLGKSVYSYKMQSLIYGGIAGALGGLVLAIATQSVQPDTYSSPITFYAYLALILGGTARVLGPVLGSMVFWMVLAFTDVALRQAIRAGHISEAVMSGTQVGQVRFMLVGLGLMLLMIFRPEGFIGDRREMELDA